MAKIAPASTFRAVIFDLDGTLTDTEKYFQRAWAEAGARMGFILDREKTLALRSLGMPYLDAQLKEWFSGACRPEEMKALCHSIFNTIAKENGVELKPGAKELLMWLKAKGVIIALATAGTTDRAQKQLAETGVMGCFDKIISSNMVSRGKPAPDTYLHACGVLGVRPEEAIAVEDSPNGVKSAHAAECRVIMVPDQTEPDEEIKPMLYACVSSLAEIKGLGICENGSRVCSDRKEKDMKAIKLYRISHSPGYCDMLGGYHESALRKDKDGNWTFVCSDREEHSEPTVTVVYAVSPEAAARFEKFIAQSRVLSLEDRPKSDIFATDYSPWSWCIDYETTSFGKTKRQYCRFGEYQRYSDRDRELLNELEKQFLSLRGEKISETTEDD